MNHLPVIIGFGGVNPAGRISFHHAYRRLVIDRLNQAKQDRTYLSLAQMMGLAEDPAGARDPVIRQNILDHTLIRRIEHFDSDRVVWQSSAKLKGANEAALTFVISKRQLPQSIPPTWRINELNDREVQVTCDETLTTLLPEERVSKVSSAGQLPTGFEPGAQYPARQHPRALQMSVCGASDALRSTGFDIQALKDLVRPDQLAVYSGSAMGQLDSESYGGLLQNPLTGRRPTSKQAALGLPEMAGDFVNAYVLGSVGETAGIIGACATFLYNVKRGMDDIRSGAKKIVVIGNSEAPITPYVIEGYRTMGALAEDDVLCGLDNTTVVDNRRACRPFSSNAGFTVAEASVWMVMMADDLAMQTGARILGSVGDVHINADGYKKSISGPGIGNYLTVAKALSWVPICRHTARALRKTESPSHKSSTSLHNHLAFLIG